MESKKFNSPRVIDTLGMGVISLLILQYVLGMYANLFVEIPEGTSGWAFVGNSSMLFSHIVVGLILSGFAVAHLIMSFRMKKTAWVFFSVIGLLSILAALFAGSVFMGEEADSYSFIMAVGTGVSLLAYAAGIYYSAKHKE